MKRSLVLVLTLLLLTATGALAGKQPDRDSALDIANRALQGRRAVVELSNGELLSGVQEVFMGPDFTTWELSGKTGQVATADVKRIALSKRSRIHKWSRRGLIVGALAGSISGGYSEVDGAFLEPLDASNIAQGALTGAAVGAAAGAIAGEKVVFEAGDADTELAR